MWKIILALRIGLLVLRKAYEEEIGIIDSAPIPVVAYKRDKRHTDFTTAGYGKCCSKLCGTLATSSIRLLLFVEIFLILPHDSQGVEELVGAQETLLYMLGDKAYWAPELMRYLKEQRGIILLASKKDKQKQTAEEKKYSKQYNRIRLLVETINAQLQEQLHLSKHYAKSTWGLMTRVAAKVTMHTLATVINHLFGRPPLALASLAV